MMIQVFDDAAAHNKLVRRWSGAFFLLFALSLSWSSCPTRTVECCLDGTMQAFLGVEFSDRAYIMYARRPGERRREWARAARLFFLPAAG